MKKKLYSSPIILQGSIELICGPMFSGKTEELIQRLKYSYIAKFKVVAFKPKLDTRYHLNKIATHSNQFLTSYSVNKAEEILEYIQITSKKFTY